MQINPADLGVKYRDIVVRHRAGSKHASSETSVSPFNLWMSRLWLGKHRAHYSPQTVAASAGFVVVVARLMAVLLVPVNVLVMMAVRGPYGGDVSLAPLFLFAPISAGAGLYLVPRLSLLNRCRKLQDRLLTATEVATLLPLANDDLERAYLTLVLDVVRGDVEQGPGGDLRQALRALGDAIDKLPATRATGADSADIMTEVLRRTAEETLKRAQVESDRVVAASFIRRAEALHRRADATTRSHLLVRRFSALRQEMAAEIEALRAGLAAFYTGVNDISDLTRLANDVQRVAAEAAAITEAVEEVDENLGGSSRDDNKAVHPGYTSA